MLSFFGEIVNFDTLVALVYFFAFCQNLHDRLTLEQEFN